MMYLRDTTKQGALRLIPGSHRPEYQDPTVRALAEPPEVWERWRAKAEAAHRELPLPDAEISVYQPAAEHRLRTGMKPWRSVEGP